MHRPIKFKNTSLTLLILLCHGLGQIWIWLVRDCQVAPKVIEHEALEGIPDLDIAPSSFWKLGESQGTLAHLVASQNNGGQGLVFISFKNDAVRC